jgi:hypothetical protein
MPPNPMKAYSVVISLIAELLGRKIVRLSITVIVTVNAVFFEA